MLDVHPPHAAAHTWKDFFIHIATIVIGLCIAVGLEQTVEFFHHRHQRHQLQEDLRDEARRNIARIGSNEKSFAIDLAWYRDTLKAGREGGLTGGNVTFVIPPRAATPPAIRPLDNAWNAAVASGAVAVLPPDEVETFGRVNQAAELAETAVEARTAAFAAERAVLDRLGLTLTPGTTIRMTAEQRDELMRALAVTMEGYRQLANQDAVWQGSSEAVLNNVHSPDEMQPYVSRAIAAAPH